MALVDVQEKQKAAAAAATDFETSGGNGHIELHYHQGRLSKVIVTKVC